jgi:hypothetical protein
MQRCTRRNLPGDLSPVHAYSRQAPSHEYGRLSARFRHHDVEECGIE